MSVASVMALVQYMNADVLMFLMVSAIVILILILVVVVEKNSISAIMEI